VVVDLRKQEIQRWWMVSFGRGIYNKLRIVVVCSATSDNDGHGTTCSMTFSMLKYSLKF